MATIAGYNYGDPGLAPSPLTQDDLDKIKQSLLMDDSDIAALRRAHDILEPQIEAILDVWYGFVADHDFLLSYFATPSGPDSQYLDRVRARFSQWVLDLTRADFDDAWLSYQEEIGRRHHLGKNETDDVTGAPPLVHHRYLVALAYPIFATVRPFLEHGAASAEELDAMHQAWLKAVLLSVILWSRPYLRDGAF